MLDLVISRDDDDFVCNVTISLSLTSFIFPKEMKKALVKPLIRKTSLDPSGYKNYRSVSNLGFVSKVIERAVAGRLKSYISIITLTLNYIQHEELSIAPRLPLYKWLATFVQLLAKPWRDSRASRLECRVWHWIMISLLDELPVVWINCPSYGCNVCTCRTPISSTPRFGIWPSVICHVCAPIEWRCSTTQRVHAHNWMLLLNIRIHLAWTKRWNL